MLNSVSLMGRITHDLELRHTKDERSVISFRIAVDRDYQPNPEEKRSDFLEVTAWNGTAEFISKYFKKGQLIVVHGRLESNNYTDKEGNKKYSLRVVADGAYFSDGKKPGNGEGENAPATEEPKGEAGEERRCPF